MATIKGEGLSQLPRVIIKSYQNWQPFDLQDAAERAKLNMIEALTPVPFSEEEVINAVGDATDPNAVSRAGRSRLPHIRI